MSGFPTTNLLVLTSASTSGHTDTPLSSGTVSWTGWSNASTSGTITDVDGDGALDREIDALFGSFTFSGYYVTIDGKNYGQFNTGPTWIIPYHSDNPINDPAVFPNGPNSTTSFTTQLSQPGNCFLAGTLMTTPTGSVPIEGLKSGDLITTADGGTTQVRWLWRLPIPNIFAAAEDRAPICVTAGALGPGCPVRDLFVSADHALLIDDLLINAGALVNGSSIRRIAIAQMPDQFTYWHVETDAHEVILAEGCAAESFIDYAGRGGFDTYRDYLDVFGADRPLREMALPRVTSRRLLPHHIRKRFDLNRAA